MKQENEGVKLKFRSILRNLGFVVAGMGFLLAVAALPGVLHRHDLLANGVAVRSQVMLINGKSSIHVSYHGTSGYMVQRDFYYPQSIQAGESLHVLFDRSNPSSSMIAPGAVKGDLGGPYAMAFIGLAALAVGGAMATASWCSLPSWYASRA